MTVTDAIAGAALGLEESQNQRDARVEELWRKLDPQNKGELDLRGLQRGLKRIDHRESKRRFLSMATWLWLTRQLQP